MTSQASLASPTSKTVLNGGRIPAGKENVPLSWKNTPDKVTVRVWKITDAGNETAEPESERTLKNPYTITMEKNKIYEVIATWNQDDFEERGFYGEGYYRFVTA